MYLDANGARTHAAAQPHCSFFVRYITVSGSHFSPLSANVVANQGFIVAAAAQSLQRQNKAPGAFVPPLAPFNAVSEAFRNA